MKICIIYSSPKLGDIMLHLPFIKAISDKYNKKVSICINQCIGIKKILNSQVYIDHVIENYFRRGKFFLKDHFKLYQELKKNNFTHVFILEKTKGTAMACFFSGIKYIYGFGIGSQKFFVNTKYFLERNDLRYNYTDQSIKFLSKFNIFVNFNQKFLTIKSNEKNYYKKKFLKFPRPLISLGVDSTETNRVWPQKKFSNLCDRIINKKKAGTIFVISGNDHTNYFKNIQINSKYPHQFFNCKKFNRSELIYLIDICDYFVGIDSGPSCIAGALKKKTFCIIGPTDASLLRFQSMKKIISNFYDKKREIGLVRCGDNFDKTDKEVKTITVNKVFDTIMKNL